MSLTIPPEESHAVQQLLEAFDYDALEELAARGHNFNAAAAAHPPTGSAMMSPLPYALDQLVPHNDADTVWRMVVWLLDHGADPMHRCPYRDADAWTALDQREHGWPEFAERTQDLRRRLRARVLHST